MSKDTGFTDKNVSPVVEELTKEVAVAEGFDLTIIAFLLIAIYVASRASSSSLFVVNKISFATSAESFSPLIRLARHKHFCK